MKKIVLGLSIAASSLLASDCILADGAVGVKVGTLGVGVEYTAKVNDKLDLRLGVNKYTYSDSGIESDINYDIDLKLQTVAAIADYHVFNNGFVLSAGLMYNDNKIEFDAKTSATYTINDVSYTANDIGSLNGKVDFNNIAPYIGMGYSNATNAPGWSFSTELGALYQGKPNTSLNVTCGSGLTVAQCNTLRADVLAEQSQLNSEIDGYKWYPVLSVGVAYKF